MTRNFNLPLGLIWACIALYTPSASAEASMPSHCRKDEVTFLDAWMGPIDDELDGEERYEAGGKLLSLCVVPDNDRIAKLTYRFGKLRHPKVEVIASRHSKFGVYSRQDTPHSGQDIVFFKRGQLTYYVVIAIGQGHGVTLYEFKGNRKMATYHSAFEEGVAYQVGPMADDVFFHRVNTPFTVWAKPPHRYEPTLAERVRQTARSRN